MVKKVVAVVLILLAGGAWLTLDYLNKQEQAAAEEMHRAVEQAHARAVAEEKAKAEARARFEAEILTELTNCKVNAEKASNDYITQHQKPVRRKPGQFTVTQAVTDEAAKMLEAARATCQQTYDTRFKAGT